MWFLSVISFFTAVQGLERLVNYAKNPGCEKFNMALHHVAAEGPNDTLHYIWDFTSKLRPTIFLSLTDRNTRLNVSCLDYVNRLPNSFSFTKKPHYEFFLIFNRLIEFNDMNDTGILTPHTPKISYDTKLFSWTTESVAVDDSKRFAVLTVVGTDYSDSSAALSGNFSIQLTAFGLENHDSELPRLLHSANSTQCKVSLENLFSNSGFNESRFALEFVLVSSDENTSSSEIVARKNLDDENSPGIFAMVDLMTPKSQNQLFEGAFLQWRPIIYTFKVPSLGNSSEVVAYNLTKVLNPNEKLSGSLAIGYYGYDFDSVLVEQTIMSLGSPEDKFYKKTNFSSWTFLVNYGSPEEERFSLLVILVMCIGLGLPALFILVGGTYMCARRIRRRKNELPPGSERVRGSQSGGSRARGFSCSLVGIREKCLGK